MLIIQQPSRLPQPSGLAAQQSMIAFFRNWRRNKSLLRSTSGPCYPYPRSHSTVMVVPSNRPLPTETKKKPQPRRRPPLNRAIPTIPESKSNESIMSHASRVSTAADPSATPTVDCVVIENRSAVERLPPVNKREAATMRRTEVAKEKVSPRSPLLSVAHTMREKLSKLTRRKSPSGAGVKSSQSFAGFHGAPPPPPPVDENSNRVIKSSSMEATLVPDRPSTSKVVIPQLPDPLCSDEPSETFEPPSALLATLPPPPATVQVSMKADVLTVTEVSSVPQSPIVEDVAIPEETEDPSPEQETSQVTTTGQCTTTVIVTERPRELPVSVVYQPEPTEVKKDENKENSRPEVKQVTTLIITTKKVEEIRPRPVSPEKSKSPERFVMTVKTPEAQRKHRTFVVGERPPEPIVDEEPVKKKEVRLEETPKMKTREDSKSPERYVMTVKTPEAQRKHRTFMVGQRSEEAAVAAVEVEEIVKKDKKTEKSVPKTESRETSKSPERYVLTVRTPETLRKHRVLTIKEGPPSERKIIRSRSEERPSFKIWSSLRKSLTLRRTQTFSNTDIGPCETKKIEKRTTSEERKKKEEDEKREKFVIITKTPQFLRRHHTFMVGERSRSPDVPWIEEGELTEPIATIGPNANNKREKRTRSEEPRTEKEEPTAERFIMTARTPLTMRKYQTFVVESRKKETALPTSASADVVQSKRRGDELLKELDAIYPTSSHLDSREFSSSSSRELTQFPQEYPKRITNAEMYSLTSTTPQLRRREDVASPTLFVLNKRSERPFDEEKRLEAVRESSQSDKAELRSPSMDDLTSFEDEIPMDTSTDERVKPVVAVLPLQSRPVPSPKTGRKKKKGSLSSRCGVQAQNQRGPDHRLLRGLRSAGRIFAPSFLNKKRAPPPSSAHSVTSTYSQRAPLAQSESTVVANSPLIENLPIEAWNTPRPRCTPPRAFAALIREEVPDTNGNPQQEDGCPAVSSPQFLHRGLIDDEILDQPMLVGDSFSESSDRLSDRVMNNVEHQQRRADVAPTQRNPDIIRNDALVDEGLAKVADIKNQLVQLQTLVNNHTVNDSTSLDVAGLARENDSLRRQLLEKDLLIEQLRQQLAVRPALPVSM